MVRVAQTGDGPQEQIPSMGCSIKWKDDNLGYFMSGNVVYTYDLKSNTLREVNNYAEKGGNLDLEETTYALAYTIDNNLYASIEGREIQITDDADPGIINGQTVHRNEFGISKGTFWSPGGNYLAFYRKDDRRAYA